MIFLPTTRRSIVAILFFFLLPATPILAADELLIYVFSGDNPAAGTEIKLDQTIVGKTGEDGSLLVDVSGQGTHVITVRADEGDITARFASGAGQLVDAVVQVETKYALA